MGAMTTVLHRTTGARIQVTRQGASTKHYVHAIYGPSNAMQCYSPLDRLGFEFGHELGRFEIVR